jgi:hypothetical protein
MSKAKDEKIFLNEIFHPAEGENVPVKRPMTMPGFPSDPNQPGTLCVPCTGKVTRSGYLYGIYIRCQKGTWQDTNPSGANYFPNSDVTSNSQSVYIPVGMSVTSYTWSSSTAGPVAAWGADTSGNTKNTIKSVASFFPMGSGSSEDTDLKHFDGTWVDTCPAIRPAAAAAPAALDTVEPMFGPTQKDGDWLLYEGLPVSAIGIGNLLSRHGTPLQASVLAVAAARVYWCSRLPNGTVVRRPCGDLVPTGVASPFAKMSRNALIIHQAQHRHVLVSECRDKPDLIHLNRDASFRIHVNFESPVLPTAGLLDGSYDLWVKVID